jgi:hypothetical protein
VFVDINEAADARAADSSDVPPSALRRRLLAAGVGGAAVSLLPWLGGRASAAKPQSTPTTTGGSTGAGAGSGSSSTTSTAAPTTTQAPVKRPTADDLPMLGFAQQFEIAARDLYDSAIASGSFQGEELRVVETIREDHEAYGQAIAGLLGRDAATGRLDDLFDELESDFGGDRAAILQAASALENTAVATHLDLVGTLTGVEGAALISSIITVEARHATALNVMAGITDLDQILRADGDALTPGSAA